MTEGQIAVTIRYPGQPPGQALVPRAMLGQFLGELGQNFQETMQSAVRIDLSPLPGVGFGQGVPDGIPSF